MVTASRLRLTILLVLLFSLSMLAGTVQGQAPPTTANSVEITVEGEDPKTGLREGDVVHKGTVVDGECSLPNVAMRLSGDVTSVRVGMNEDCNMVVEEIELNSTPMPEEAEDEAAGGLSHTWRVQALAKVVGLASIDDLTKSKSSVKFKTDHYSGGGRVFGGSGQRGTCWGNHFPSPPFYYYVDKCTLTYSLSGPSQIWAKTKGDYYHTQVPSWGHTTTAKAIGKGYQYGAKMFDAQCTGSSLPPSPASLECELYWEYVNE